MTEFRTLRAGICISLVLLGGRADIDLAAQANLSPVPAKELVRIRAEEANLTAIAVLAVSDKGVLAVSQRRDGQVRLFSPTGRPVATLGRSGAGPWEFRRLDALGWVGDTLWVADQALKRITTFHASGASGEMTELPLQVTARSITTMRFMFPIISARLPDGTLLVQASGLPLPEGSQPNPVMNDPRYALRVSSEGSLQRIIGTDPPDSCRRARGADGTTLSSSICPRKVVATRPDGSRRVLLTAAVTSRGLGNYQVLAVNASGDTLYRRTYSVPLARISGPGRDSLLEGVGESNGMMSSSDIPYYYAPLHEAQLGPDGELWIALNGGHNVLREWQRLDPRGRPLPSVWIPRAAKVMALESRGAWAVVTDDNGFQDIVLYGAPPP